MSDDTEIAHHSSFNLQSLDSREEKFLVEKKTFDIEAIWCLAME